MSSTNENIVLSAIGTRTVLNLISFRRTIPKLNDIRSIQHYVNLIWLILPIGLLITGLSLPFTLFIKTDNAEKYPFYYHACVFYAVAAFIELLSEPFYLLANMKLNYHVNIYIEIFSSTIGFTIQAFLIYKNPVSALYYYGLGRIIYSLLITSSYYIFFLTRKQDERRRLFLITSFQQLIIKPTSPYFDHKLLNETKTFFKQGIWMKILTEGERYIMSLFNVVTYKDQAIFDTINNLGSLLPRLIFATLEESAYAYFQQTLSRTRTVIDQHVQDDTLLVHARHTEEINPPQPPLPTEQQTIRLNALTFYNYLLRFVILTSLLVIAFGIPYTPFLLNLYGGSNLTDGPGPLLLRLYCVYILFLATNGITEAFSQATMSMKELENYKNLISIFAMLYLVLFYMLIKLIGIHGIIIANCVNMSARIITNLYYIYRYFHGIQWSKPFEFSFYYLFILTCIPFICCYSEAWFSNSLIHFSFGAILGLAMLLLTWKEEKEMIHYIYCILRLNREKKTA